MREDVFVSKDFTIFPVLAQNVQLVKYFQTVSVQGVAKMPYGLEIYVNVILDIIIFLEFVLNVQKTLFGMELVVQVVDKILISLQEFANVNQDITIFQVFVISALLVLFLMEKTVFYHADLVKFGLDRNVCRFVKKYLIVIGMEYNVFANRDFTILQINV